MNDHARLAQNNSLMLDSPRAEALALSVEELSLYLESVKEQEPEQGGVESELTAQEIQLSVIIPTFNERENVRLLYERLNSSLRGLRWEAIFVDDLSSDGTSSEVRALARRDNRVRLICRHNRRGLSSAVIEGALAGAANVIAIMDGDLQHDPAVLVELYERVASGEADLAAASRFLSASAAQGLASKTRVQISETGIALANKLFRLGLTDPLTGFFALRRDVIERALPELSELGFKILLDIIVSSKPRPKVVEVAFDFKERQFGASKLDHRVIYEFFLFFLDKSLGRILPLPVRFYSFAFVGGMGVFVHLTVLGIAYSLLHSPFVVAQSAATIVALLFNFSFNNLITYFDRRLKGGAFVRGFILFALLCSVGVVGNVGVATVLHRHYQNISYFAPALVGILVGVAWNFAATNLFVWGKKPAYRRSRNRPADA